jgi:DNA-directed RNA polymerase subunit K/omega
MTIDYKKSKASVTTVTRDLNQLDKETNNIYQTVMIVAKRANQISVEVKQELNRKLEEFAYYTDNLEEVFENR